MLKIKAAKKRLGENEFYNNNNKNGTRPERMARQPIYDTKNNKELYRKKLIEEICFRFISLFAFQNCADDKPIRQSLNLSSGGGYTHRSKLIKSGINLLSFSSWNHIAMAHQIGIITVSLPTITYDHHHLTLYYCTF